MSKSALEENLCFQLRACGAPAFEREYAFAPGRRFRFDFAFIEQRLAIEVQGGTWMDKGRHNTGSGLHDSYEKLNLACELGWFVLQYDSSAIRSGEAVAQILRVIERLEAGQ